MKSRHLVVAALALALAACQSPRPAQQASNGQAQKQDPSAPVAKIGSQTITAGELDELVKRDLSQLEQQYQEQKYQLRRQALEAMIRKRIVEEKAKAQNVTPEEMVQKEIGAKVAEPSDEEARALYDRAKAGGQQLPPFDQVKPEIVRFIKNQKAQGLLADYYEQLKKDAKVEVLLPAYEPPKVQVAATGPAKGPQAAPVTIVEFSDFECPFCVRAEGTVKQVLDAYPDKIRLVYRDFPLPMHARAPKAAEAAHCAEDQGKYWDMHEKLFGSGNKIDVPDLKRYAGELKLDQAKFDKCLDSGEKASIVEGHKKAGEEAGVSGTPAFFINGRMLSGAQPMDAFKKIIDEELASAGKK
ncbi:MULTISPECIES: thioredoxin domain-containing protein [Anaeromyxobacter]|uniref:thioredoxin domain-containing protein n=1 Tax=Anaeromyxobacter TaxID=161492 RepID=UPI001F5A0FEA|nr:MULTISPECIES: thioredoxin domain-containing protein [unclassified Anaeromyxobacter]